MSRNQIAALAMRLGRIRPRGDGTENAERRVWADCVNVITGSGLVPDAQLRDFRQIAGWESSIDRAVNGGRP